MKSDEEFDILVSIMNVMGDVKKNEIFIII